MLQNRRISPNSPLASLLKRAHLLLLIVIGAVAVAVPMSAQSFTAAGTKTGSILGTRSTRRSDLRMPPSACSAPIRRHRGGLKAPIWR